MQTVKDLVRELGSPFLSQYFKWVCLDQMQNPKKIRLDMMSTVEFLTVIESARVHMTYLHAGFFLTSLCMMRAGL
jgi:hypothetical protein